MKNRAFRFILVLLILASCIAGTAMAACPKVTALTIGVNGPVYVTQAFTITGKLTSGPTGMGVSDKLITVSKLTGLRWKVIGTARTDSDGSYSLQTTETTHGMYFYRASLAEDKDFKMVTSPLLIVMVMRIPTEIHSIGPYCTLHTCGIGAKLYDHTNGISLEGKSVLLLKSTSGGRFWKRVEVSGNPCTTSSPPPEPGIPPVPPVCFVDVPLPIAPGTIFKWVFFGDAIYAPSSSETF
jgi:hypothetical protein